jgi:hypothetical protein
MLRHLNEDELAMLSAYLDGDLTAEERIVFEQQIAADPELRRHVEWQRHIQQQLKADLEIQPLRERVLAGINQPRPSGRSRRLVLVSFAAAAAILVYFGVGDWIGSLLVPERDSSYLAPKQLVTPAQAYRSLIANGFKPEEVCTPSQVAEWTGYHLGTQLVVAMLPDKVELLGWSYGNSLPGTVIGRTSAVLLARVEGRETVVLMDDLERDRDLPDAGEKGLHLFRAELGNVVMYEITPFDQPNVINLFKLNNSAQ